MPNASLLLEDVAGQADLAGADELARARPVHARWSPVNAEFLDFVERNPECLQRDAFASLSRDPSLAHYSLQPWPLFVGARRRGETAEVAVGMDRLVKGVMERFLDNAPARIVEFYRGTPPADGSPSMALQLDEGMMALLLEEPSGVDAAPSRADYIETAEGLKFIEYNAGSALGGLHSDTLGELYLESEPVARFLAARGRRARASAIRPALFRHVVEDTVRLGAWQGGDFNVAVAVRPHRPSVVALHSQERYTDELRSVLREHGPAGDGRVLLCSLEEIAADRSGLSLQGHRVHAVIDHQNGQGDLRHVFRAFKIGQANLFGGPVGDVLSDKRNLAVLSEHAGSSEFTAAERGLIERHLPWTRRVVPGATAFRGRGFHIPDDLPGARASLVLKKASSLGGQFVEIGPFLDDGAWRRAVARAVEEGDWVVQEYLPTVPYAFQGPAGGAVRHELVWGLFVFGAHYGGAYLRMRAAGHGGGVVNAGRGAEVGAILEVDD
ncbi:MAG TPA: hypothetical protein VFJ82_14735 [Longimicrobium sp.]|nr:hypothetical protein [Longimicrobium sp.]